MSKRPEKQAPLEIFYGDVEAQKYATSSRIIDIQSKLSERALELLALPEAEDHTPRLLLDIGCGSGLSGAVLSKHGHYWMGVDMSKAMLDIAALEQVKGDLVLSDIGQGLMFRPGSIDGAISISVVHWLCNADKSSDRPWHRLRVFFASLHTCLAVGARAVLQIYPENEGQMTMIQAAALRAGFRGGFVQDYPHSIRAKKTFLCLDAGPANLTAVTTTNNCDKIVKKQKVLDENGKGKAWIVKKKNKRPQRGFDNVPLDTKYTGRKRKAHF